MKIALLGARSSIHTVRWANALVGRGHEVHLFTLHEGGDPLDSRVLLHKLPGGAPAGYVFSALFLRQLLTKIRPDLLHAHFASGYGTLGRLSGFHPYVVSVWGSDVYEFPDRSFLHRRLLQGNLLAADHVCSTSRTMAEHTYTLCPGLHALTVTPFGVDTDRFRPMPELRDPSVITIGTVKSLESKYGIDLLIRSFARAFSELKQVEPEIAKKLRLLIVGGGSQRVELEALAEQLGIAHITEFRGRVPHEEVPRLLNRLDIYVALSRSDSESFGVAVLEASACGVPVLVSDVGGLPEVVKDGVTGFVVPRESIDDAAKVLVRLILDEYLRRKLGQQGRRHVRYFYSWQASIDTMESIYSQVVAEKSGERV